MKRAVPHIALILGGIALLVATALLVDGNEVAPFEESVFRFINGLPDAIYWPVWVVMQLGNLLAVPAAIVVALALRRWSLAAGFAVVGVGKLYFSRLVKELVTRERPASVIDEVIRRGDASAAGLAFVSGHAVIVVGLATVLHPHLNRRSRVVAWTLAGIMCFGRVYVGAHMPLDMIGGAGLGVAIGSVVNLVRVLWPWGRDQAVTEPSSEPAATPALPIS